MLPGKTVNLIYIMVFGEKMLLIKILNSEESVHTMKELREAAIDNLYERPGRKGIHRAAIQNKSG